MRHPIARYLMCAYSYYELDDPLITDNEFDRLAKWLLLNYDHIEHPHKTLISKDDLDGGTYLGKYPEMVKGAVESWNSIEPSRKKAILRNSKRDQDKYIQKSGTLEDFF